MTMLEPIRVTTLLMLLIILIAQNFSNTSSYQGSNIAAKRHNILPNPEANSDGVHAAAVIRENKLNGRKLASTKKVKENIIEENKQVEKAENHVICQQKISRRQLSLVGEKNMGGYVAFTADYKLPRHHPPKNN